jgi:hypothetical protein
MSHPTTRRARWRPIAVAILCLSTLSGCTIDGLMSWFGPSLSASDANLIATRYNTYHTEPEPMTCLEALDAYWPGSSLEWARIVVERESGGDRFARNPSGASGCFQLMMPLHADLLRAVGCASTAWADAGCNVRAALILFRGSGTSPWAQTSPT